MTKQKPFVWGQRAFAFRERKNSLCGWTSIISWNKPFKNHPRKEKTGGFGLNMTCFGLYIIAQKFPPVKGNQKGRREFPKRLRMQKRKKPK